MKRLLFASLLLISVPAAGVVFATRTPPAAQQGGGQTNAPDKAEQHRAAEDAARKVTEAWLALVDAGKFEESYEQAADGLKSLVAKEPFVSSLEAARNPLGELKTRKLVSTRYTNKLGGAPEGEYVVVKFKSSFAHGDELTETIVPMLDKDGKWRVSGYYIK